MRTSPSNRPHVGPRRAASVASRAWIAWPVALLSATAAAACGSRSGLPDAETGARDAAVEAAPEAAAPPSAPCTSDADCSSGAYCLVGTCDADAGCVSAPRDCDDGVSCTRDTCSEITRSCVHTPDDSLCPNTELCSPRRDCDPFVYAVGTDNHLYETRVPSGQVFDVGLPAAAVGDVALTGNGVLYATDSYILYRLDRATAAATAVASILPLHMYNGLGVAADGSLLATADAPSLFRIDPMTGASTALAPLPAGYQASGDVTTFGGRVLVPLVSLADLSAASLGSFDAVTLSPVVAGALVDRCIWGIAVLGGVVYELDCNRVVFTVDPRTGTSTAVGKSTVAFLGAAGR